jgi:hypothetical protein
MSGGTEGSPNDSVAPDGVSVPAAEVVPAAEHFPFMLRQCERECPKDHRLPFFGYFKGWSSNP